ncbi:MAG: hemolysin family protein [Myxococcota bacterium]|nr:hemolysin family protein [Myxococcota bacterium]
MIPAAGIDPVWGIPTVILLLFFSAFFSSCEAAIFSLQPAEQEGLKNKGRTGRLVTQLLSQPKRTLASVLMGNEFVNVTLSTVCAGIVMYTWPEKSWINLLIAAPLLILLGEITPKTFALRYRRNLSRVLAVPLNAWALLVTPLRWVLTVVSDNLIRLLGVNAGELVSVVGESQVRRLIDEGAESGAIGETEQEIIHRVFEFTEMPVSQLMTARADIVSISINAPGEAIADTVRKTGFSRSPVYRGRPDRIVGILVSKDLLRFKGRNPSSRQILGLLRQPYLIPPTKQADDLFRDFQRYRIHLALVVNERGTILGMVTMDDLLGELMGDDEVETQLEEASRTLPDEWRVSPGMSLSDFGDQAGVQVPTDAYSTIGAFVSSLLPGEPKVGSEAEFAGLGFIVTEFEHNRIVELAVYDLEDPENRPETEETFQ